MKNKNEVKKNDVELSAFEKALNEKEVNVSQTFKKLSEKILKDTLQAIKKVCEENSLTVDNVLEFQKVNLKKFEKEEKKRNSKCKELKENRVFSFLVSKELNISLSTNNERMSESVNLRNRTFVTSFLSLKEKDIEFLNLAYKAHYKNNI